MSTPDWLVERLALGELPADQAAEVRRRLAEEPGGLERLAALERSNADILAAHPPARVSASIRHRAGERRPLGWRGALVLAAPALAAAVAVMAIRTDPAAVGEGPEVIRLKGAEPKLVVHRQSGATAERLSSGAAARQRDLLQLSYIAATARYGAIVSVDGRGAVTQHLPEAGGVAALLQPGGSVALPQSYELDDAPSYERFFLVTGERPFDVETVIAAAREAGGRDLLELPADLRQTSFFVKKVP